MSISKEDAVKALKAKNVRAELDKGIVMIYQTNGKPTFDETKKILKEIDYQMSFGYHKGSNSKNNEFEENQKEDVIEDYIEEEETQSFEMDDEGQISFTF